MEKFVEKILFCYELLEGWIKKRKYVKGGIEIKKVIFDR